jgi:palmitoyltransferase
LTHKSTPGFITPKTFKLYDHYAYDPLLFPPGRRCQSTNIIKIPRSKFDRIKYKANIPRYDHFCGWVYNTIGEENYRWFLLFLAAHVVMCVYGSAVCFLLFRGEIREKQLLELTFFDRATGESVESNWFIVVQFLFAQETAVCSVMIVMIVMAIALAGFLGYHVSSKVFEMLSFQIAGSCFHLL